MNEKIAIEILKQVELQETTGCCKKCTRKNGTCMGCLDEAKNILINYTSKLQSNWNSLREWLKNKIDNFQDDVSEPILHEQMTMRVIYEHMENLDKMNELEGKVKE